MSQALSDILERLILKLPTGAFVEQPEEIDRLFVRLWPDGAIYFNGTRARVEEFLHICAEAGIEIQIDHISMCG